MPIHISVKVDEKELAAIGKMPKDIRSGLLKGLRKGMFEAERVSKSRMGRPDELHIRTGHLRRSIESGVNEKGNNIIGWLGSNVIYARIHEFGGIIKPVRGQYLKFPIGDSWVSVRQVRIPPRPYLEPSIRESMDTISKIISNTIISEVEDEH